MIGESSAETVAKSRFFVLLTFLHYTSIERLKWASIVRIKFRECVHLLRGEIYRGLEPNHYLEYRSETVPCRYRLHIEYPIRANGRLLRRSTESSMAIRNAHVRASGFRFVFSPAPYYCWIYGMSIFWMGESSNLTSIPICIRDFLKWVVRKRQNALYPR